MKVIFIVEVENGNTFHFQRYDRMYQELDDGRHTSLDRVFLAMTLNLLTFIEWLYAICLGYLQLLYDFRYKHF
jgi:hypothetical protein